MAIGGHQYGEEPPFDCWYVYFWCTRIRRGLVHYFSRYVNLGRPATDSFFGVSKAICAVLYAIWNQMMAVPISTCLYKRAFINLTL